MARKSSSDSPLWGANLRVSLFCCFWQPCCCIRLLWWCEWMVTDSSMGSTHSVSSWHCRHRVSWTWLARPITTGKVKKSNLLWFLCFLPPYPAAREWCRGEWAITLVCAISPNRWRGGWGRGWWRGSASVPVVPTAATWPNLYIRLPASHWQWPAVQWRCGLPGAHSHCRWRERWWVEKCNVGHQAIAWLPYACKSVSELLHVYRLRMLAYLICLLRSSCPSIVL